MKQFLYFIVAVLLISCSSKQDANPVETAVHYIDYVNPIIGTNGMGHTFPGACAPYGIVQLSPDTDTIPVVKDGRYQPRVYEYCAGYQHKDSTIVGFSHTHFSGTGHSDLGDILIMPTTGKVKLNPGTQTDPDGGYRSRFSHDTEIAKPTVMGTIKKYTIGLPGVILGAIRKEKPDIVLPAGGADDTPKPLVLTKDEVKVLKAVAENVSLAVDKKEGYITLNVVGSEPIQTAELAMKAQQLLQDEITRFRIEKSESELEYIQARYDEIKQETEMYQEQLARITDRSQSTIGTRNEIERNRIQSKYTTANTIYNELAKQLEQAKLQVKRDTPVLTVIQPVTVPDRPSNSRAKTLIVWTFFGGILGCGIVLGRGYWPKLKEQFKA